MIYSFKVFEDKIERAKKFAEDAHKGQYRRGVDEQGNKLEYFVHPDSVAKLVQELKKSHKIAHLVAAAYLHDTVEDTGIDIHDIQEEFGDLVASLVQELTSDEEQLKLVGKEKYLTQKLLTMTSWGLVIKLADRLDNVKEIPDLIKNGTKKQKIWAIRYASQTKAMITVLEKKRELSTTQKLIVDKIKEKIQVAF